MEGGEGVSLIRLVSSEAYREVINTGQSDLSL